MTVPTAQKQMICMRKLQASAIAGKNSICNMAKKNILI